MGEGMRWLHRMEECHLCGRGRKKIGTKEGGNLPWRGGWRRSRIVGQLGWLGRGRVGGET